MFPSVLNTFVRPTASDRLNSPSHSALHNTVSSALGQVQAVIGVEGTNSVVGSLQYLIKSPASDGGGHIQTANKGGTGQTSYNKGDILVAQSSSVLTKLAIGVDGQVLQANSSVATGITWASNSTPKLAVSGTASVLFNTASETSIFSVTVPGSVLGTSNAVRARLFVNNINTVGTADTITIRGNYGTTSVATIFVSSIVGGVSARGFIDLNIIAGGHSSLQSGVLVTDITQQTRPYLPNTSFVGMRDYGSITLNVESNANQPIGITGKWNTASTDNVFTTGGYIVEKIT